MALAWRRRLARHATGSAQACAAGRRLPGQGECQDGEEFPRRRHRFRFGVLGNRLQGDAPFLGRLIVMAPRIGRSIFRRLLEHSDGTGAIVPVAETMRTLPGHGAEVQGGQQQAYGGQHGQPRRTRTHLAARPAGLDSLADRLEQKLTPAWMAAPRGRQAQGF